MRLMHILEAAVYGAWWIIIHYTYPQDYNPVWSRLVVVLPPVFFYFSSYRSRWVAQHIESLFYATIYLLVAHNFYAKHMNYNNVAWPVATYITIMAVCACFQSSRALAYFSVYAFVLGTYIANLHHFVYPFYIPSLATILITMNVVLYYRNGVIAELAESKVRFEKLFNAVWEGVALHENGIVLAVNESFAKMFHYDRDQLIGKKIIDLVADVSRPKVLEGMSTKGELSYELWGRQFGGKVFPLELSAKRHLLGGREVRMVAVRDMTERYNLESERQKKLEAQAAVKLRDQFISIASHELKTPLTPLRLANDILLRIAKDRNIGGLSEDQVIKMLESTGAQISRLTKLIDDMLDVSRLNAGHFDLHLDTFDLVSAMREIIRMYLPDTPQTRSLIKLQARGEIWVTWDRSRMEQVFANLIKNALLYGNGKEIVVTLRNVGKNVFVFVRDRGIGIESTKISRIFERYERAVSSKNYGGLGLGLYIVKRIVEAHQGKVGVKSLLGKGSCFVVAMPRKALQAQVSFESEGGRGEK